MTDLSEIPMCHEVNDSIFWQYVLCFSEILGIQKVNLHENINVILRSHWQYFGQNGSTRITVMKIDECINSLRSYFHKDDLFKDNRFWADLGIIQK